ncbi:MAG: DUF4956 domain-containing protein [Phycisphaerae bacterium]|nr:DUF4956 domain-containing protein [Gemmatimonadaceae bacterium]
MAEAAPPARPIFRVLARTLVWYVVTGGIWLLIRDFAPTTWGALLTESFAPMIDGRNVPSVETVQKPALIPTVIAMLSALATALPVTWIYTYTRQRKGYQQSVVQTFLILPVIVAGIVVLVKHSVALAFSLGGIVAAMRFRTTLEDSKDAANIFVVTGIGLAAAVEPPVAYAISIGYNLLVLALWYTDFGRAPSLEGAEAEQRMKRALATANRTGMFVAKLDDEVLRELAPEQLEALADRAWKRRKRVATESHPTARPEFSHLLRIRTIDAEACRLACEPQFSELFRVWKYMGKTKEADGVKILEYGVVPVDTVTIGVVSDALRSLPTAAVRGVELRA